MACETFKAEMPDGRPVYGIVCTRGQRRRRCVDCGRPADYLCDWKLRGRKAGKTCDRPVCGRCATVPELDGAPVPDKHLCQAHGRAWAKHPRATG